MADDPWLYEREALEKSPEHQISVDAQPQRWHVVVLMLRNQLIKTVNRFKAIENSAEWQWFVSRGYLLVPPHKAFPLRVTPGTYERALAILNALCFAAEDRGFFVSLNDDESRVLWTGHDGEVEVRLAERLDQKFSIERSSEAGRLTRVRELTPTGTLRLFVCGSVGSETQLGDVPNRPLEISLNEVFLHVYRQVLRCRKGRERERQDLQATSWNAAEQCRRKELLVEVRHWQDAELIRSYVMHLLKQAPQTLVEDPWVEWRRWALQVADELDPTARRLKGEE